MVTVSLANTAHYFVGSLCCKPLDMGKMQFRVRNDWENIFM